MRAMMTKWRVEVNRGTPLWVVGSRAQSGVEARSDVLVCHDRFSVVVREWVLEEGSEDRFGRRVGARADPDPLVPKPEVTKDALDDLSHVDQGDDAHFP